MVADKFSEIEVVDADVVTVVAFNLMVGAFGGFMVGSLAELGEAVG